MGLCYIWKLCEKKKPTPQKNFASVQKLVWFSSTVQPDSPQIVKCQMMDQKLEVIIEPPHTWSSTHSFFSLENQIEYVEEDENKVGAF